MIPEGSILVVEEPSVEVRGLPDRVDSVLEIGHMGPVGQVTPEAVEHTRNTDNPHKLRLDSVGVPEDSADRWFMIGPEGKTVVLAPDPIMFIDFPEPPDIYVKADSEGPQGYLDAHVSDSLEVSGGTGSELHAIHLAGEALNLPLKPMCFYGTDVGGQKGFVRFPMRRG